MDSKKCLEERGRMMNKKRKALTILSTCLIIGCSAFLYQNNHNNGEIISASANPEQLKDANTNLVIAHDILVASNFSDMVEQSEIVVLGTYNNFDSSWNMARDPNDLYKEATDHYIEGKLYNFTVDEVLAGDLQTNEIRINHRYSEIINYEETSGDEIISPEGILIKEPSEVTLHKLEIIDPSFVEPEYGKQYIVFLKKSFDTDNNIYLRAIEPYLISIDDNDVATLNSNLLNNNHAHFTNDITLNNTTLSISNEVSGQITDDFIEGKSLEELKSEIDLLKK